jgi:hypothetical protein
MTIFHSGAGTNRWQLAAVKEAATQAWFDQAIGRLNFEVE